MKLGLRALAFVVVFVTASCCVYFIYFEVDVHRKNMDAWKLTKIVHQSWKTKEVPKTFNRYIASWKTCFPTWEHKHWTVADNRELIVSYYPCFLPKYDSLPSPIYKVDCARIIYMLHFGGLYTDMDNECIFPFEHLLRNYSIVFGDIDHVPRVGVLKENYVQNSFMYSRPNHPFWVEMLLEIVHAQVTRTADIVTGPVLLSTMINRWRTRYPQTHNIKIYEARYFNPITWDQQYKNPKYCKIWDGMTESEYKQCHLFHLERGSYVVQYHK